MTSWLDKELAACEFPDARLTKRFKTLTEQLSEGRGETIPMACQDWASTKAAYRFFSNKTDSRDVELFSLRALSNNQIPDTLIEFKKIIPVTVTEVFQNPLAREDRCAEYRYDDDLRPYDNANRVTQRSYSDSTPTVSFTYDQSSQTGLRTAMSDGLGSVSYTFDTMDRLTQESRTLTGVSGTFSTSQRIRGTDSEFI